MQVHNLKKSENKAKKRVGRGGKRGTFSGRGIKGQKSRAGRHIRPQARDVIKKMHKIRGRGKNYSASSTAFREKPQVVNLEDLEKKFSTGEKVTAENLANAGLVKKHGGKLPKVKILGRGELKKKLEFSDDILMSAGAKAKIDK